jgi:hypothetical protein
MNRNLDEAHLAVENARDALRENRRSDARQWAEQAARLAPHMEDPWLILAAIASPGASLEYIQKALKINPTSPRARRGLEWATHRMHSEGAPKAQVAETRQSLVSRLPGASPQSTSANRSVPGRKRRSGVPLLLVGIGLFVCAAAALSAAMSPVLASIIQQVEPTHPPSWALASIPKPTYTPGSPLAFDVQPTLVIDGSPTPLGELPTDLPETSDQGTPTVDGQPTEDVPTAEPTGSLGLDYVNETPTLPGAATSVPGYAAGGSGHWIDVNLSQQTLYAYEGNNVIDSFLVSTGTWLHPTVTGQYHIYVKLRYTDMSGPDYYLPNVPYTMYFFRGYGLHGTYWHHNFGTPMSHGCVNLSIPDAEWLYNFASVGTLVSVHY